MALDVEGFIMQFHPVFGPYRPDLRGQAVKGQVSAAQLTPDAARLCRSSRLLRQTLLLSPPPNNNLPAFIKTTSGKDLLREVEKAKTWAENLRNRTHNIVWVADNRAGALKPEEGRQFADDVAVALEWLTATEHVFLRIARHFGQTEDLKIAGEHLTNAIRDMREAHTSLLRRREFWP